MHGFAFLDELVFLSLAAVVVILVFKRFRLPPIIGLIATGIIAGPTGFALVDQSDVISVLAELGVTMLLFSIGLEFSLDDLLSMKKIVLIGGPLQIILSSLALGGATYLLMSFMEVQVPWYSILAVGMILSISSTAICISVLKQRDELLQPHGKAVLGILIAQDIAVVPMLITISILAPGAEFTFQALALRLGTLALFTVGLTWLLRKVFPRIVRYVTRTDSSEVLVLGALTLCFGAAAITDALGMSLALGAFIAGVAISESEDSRYIERVMIPFKDAFTSIFFISIGLLLNVDFHNLPMNIFNALLVIVINALVVTMLLRMLGLPLRVAATAGIILAEVGEFSFVLASTALHDQLIAATAYEDILVVIIITMIVTPFLIAAAPRMSKILPPQARKT